jgi:hypothetical protein
MSDHKRLLVRWLVAGLMLFGFTMIPWNKSARADGKHKEGFGVSSLKGRYIAAGNSSDASITDGDTDDDAPARAFVAGGFLNFDGNGKVISGEETINYGVPGSGDSFTCDLAGTYTVDTTAGRALLTLNVTPGPVVGPGESTATNASNCGTGGTDTVVGYISDPSGNKLATVEQTVVPGTPPSGVFANTPILSALVWTTTKSSSKNQND